MSEFDAERALKEGALTQGGLDVEILRTDADSPFPIIGLLRQVGGDQVARQWARDGTFNGCQSFDLKNKPHRVVKSRYLTSDIDAEYNSLICGDKIQTDACPYRLDITLEDGVPVSADIVDLREKD